MPSKSSLFQTTTGETGIVNKSIIRVHRAGVLCWLHIGYNMASISSDPFSFPMELSSSTASTIRHPHERYSPRCWIEDGRLFVSFHQKTKIIIPPRTAKPFSSHDIHQLEWIKDGYPYLAFLPFPMDCRGSLLSRLAVDEFHIPIQISDTTTGKPYAMGAVLVSSWERLEVGIISAAKVLLNRVGIPGIRTPPPPNCSSLRSTDFTRENVTFAAMQVKDRFLPWFALVSFCIALLDRPARFLMKSGREEIWSTWIGTLLISNLHPEWVGMLVDSCLSQFHRPHLGTILEFDRDPNAIYVSVMVDHEVPVVYTMDPNAMDELPSIELRKPYLDAFCNIVNRNATIEDLTNWMQKFTPPRSIASSLLASNATSDQPPHARSSANTEDCDDLTFLFDDSTAPTEVADSFPPLDDLSGQKIMEDRTAFLSKRQQENEAIMRSESLIERRRREDRAKAASNYQVPGRNSKTKVFVWDRIGTYEVRSRRNRGMFDTLWATYGTHEMKFDPVRNEWDLWSDDRKSIHPKQKEFRERSGDLLAPDLAPPGDAAELTQSDVNLEDILRRDVVEIFGGVCSKEKGGRTEQSIALSQKVPLHEMLKFWYGLVDDERTDVNMEHMSPKLKKMHEKLSANNRARTVLVDSVSPSFPHETTLVRTFLAFQITGVDVPSKLLDIHLNPIDAFGNPSVQIQKSRYEAQSISHADSPTKCLYQIELRSERGRDGDERRLFVWDATTAVAIKRLPLISTESLDHVASHLLERGIQFLFGVPRNRFGTPLSDIRVAKMGRRWRGYCPDEADYASYRQKCIELFSIDRVRRALRRGGIIWRIAMDYIEVHDGVDGPSQEVMNEPLWISDSRTKRPELVDDGLSIDEIGIIVGSYEVKDNESNDKPVHCSYWPLPWIWESSGYFVGYWTPDCEDWFVNTQRNYEDGNLAIARVEEWKARLKRFGDTKKLRTAIERQCESFLTSD